MIDRRSADGLIGAVGWSLVRQRAPSVSSGIGQGATPMGEQTIALNRRARHEYEVEDTVEAGIVLSGTEIKSIRAGKVSLQEAYARVERGEAWLIGAHIAPYAGGNRFNHEPKRTRKLLLHKDQIRELEGRTRSKGLVLVPLRLYIDERGHAKLQVGLGRGRKLHDRRREIAERDSRREVERELSEARRGG
jgi:SsrA-binding protein